MANKNHGNSLLQQPMDSYMAFKIKLFLLCQVGLQYLAGDIRGGNARCVAMLQAFSEAIKDYYTPPEKPLLGI